MFLQQWNSCCQMAIFSLLQNYILWIFLKKFNLYSQIIVFEVNLTWVFPAIQEKPLCYNIPNSHNLTLKRKQNSIGVMICKLITSVVEMEWVKCQGLNSPYRDGRHLHKHSKAVIVLWVNDLAPGFIQLLFPSLVGWKCVSARWNKSCFHCYIWLMTGWMFRRLWEC